ncbi:MAG: molybdopterin-dependent oxidoreductase [Gammaproteobacteria bacterium]|nr:molybdopterin-dependent oxidoreductase [Gammaproteobacteria bacterium]
MTKTIRSNCPRDCYDGCGIVAQVDAGKRARIGGDPEHPISRGSLCSKCGVAYNGVFQDETARLTTPLRRVGEKGSAEFAATSWDEALGTIADKLATIIDRHGAESILTMKYSGTLSLLAFFFPDRWVNHTGASQVDYGTICNAAGGLAWELLFGCSDKGFDPRTAKDSDCIVVWGANPSHCAPHMHRHWLKDSPASVVVIDPVRTETAAAADLHLQLRPGSDAALAFGLLHMLRDIGAFDDAFINTHTSGFDEISADIDRCTPEWTASQTGIPVADIEKAARLYAAGPALLWCGQGLQRQPMGGNVMRAAGLLPALTGNIGKPGAGFYYLNESAGIAGVDFDELTGAQLARGKPETVGALDLADRLSDPDEFRAFMVWNTNPLASCSDQQKLRVACSRDDLFTVAIDLFETDTVRYADIVLPAASFLEFDDITYSYMNLIVGAQSKVLEPIGESLPNQEIFRRLSAAMKLDEPSLYETDEAVIARLLEQCDVGYDFNELQRRGHFAVGGDEPLDLYKDLEFDTPGGRIEIASDKAEELGLPRVALPLVDEQPANGLLRLLSPASNWRMNDSYANEPRLEKRAGPAELFISAPDAERLGISHGAAVTVSNESGAIDLVAQVDDIVLPGTVLSYKGRWPSREPGDRNLNFLHAGRKCDMAESTSVHGLLVAVAPAGG